MLRALSLWQPHATLMSLMRPGTNPRLEAEKPFETRPAWADRIALGELAVHAARSLEDMDLCTAGGPEEDVLREHNLTPESLPLGAIVSVVDVVAVWQTGPANRGHWNLVRPVHVPAGEFPRWPRARELGDFGPGRVVLQCRNVRPLREALPLRGRQGVFVLSGEEEAAVRALLPSGPAGGGGRGRPVGGSALARRRSRVPVAKPVSRLGRETAEAPCGSPRRA